MAEFTGPNQGEPQLHQHQQQSDPQQQSELRRGEVEGRGVLELPETWSSTRRELGDEGVWTISSAKPGNGVEQLRDQNLETYWQSDGTQPHCITIQFLRRAALSEVCLYLDFGLDESYAPKKICVRAGSTEADLMELVVLDLNEPMGWTVIPLTSSEVDPLAALSSPQPPLPPLRAHLLQIQVLAMHQNGRDTHLRQVKLFGPRASPTVMGRVPLAHFHSVHMQQHAGLR